MQIHVDQSDHESSRSAAEIASRLVGRSGVILFYSAGAFLIFSKMPVLEWLGAILQLAIAFYELHHLWALRESVLWNSASVKLSTALFFVVTIAPLVAWFWLVAIRPASAQEYAAAFAMAAMSLLFLSYGILLTLAPRLAWRFDYVEEPSHTPANKRCGGLQLWWRFGGAFLTGVGLLLASLVFELIKEAIFHSRS